MSVYLRVFRRRARTSELGAKWRILFSFYGASNAASRHSSTRRIVVAQGASGADQNLPFSFGPVGSRVAAAPTERIMNVALRASQCEILHLCLDEMLRNNPPDIAYAAFRNAFSQRAIRMFPRVNGTQNIVLTDAEAWDKTRRHLFGISLRDIRGNPRVRTLGT